MQIVDGELEYTVDAITAHKLVKVGSAKKGNQRTRVMFLTAWKGYDRAHDSWEPGDMLQDTEALELYLQGIVQRGEVLPPGYAPEQADTHPDTNKRDRMAEQPVAQEEADDQSPPPAAELARLRKKRRVTFQVQD